MSISYSRRYKQEIGVASGDRWGCMAA